MRLVVAIGARPNVVKVGPLLPEFRRAGIAADLAFTGSRSAKRAGSQGTLAFFGIELPPPRWFLDIGTGTDAATTGRAMVAFEKIFASPDRPDAVMVVGDVNSTLAAAISATKAGLPVVHLEAGMRCGDLGVPEEVNRVLVSRVAAMHLTPSERALENLEDEGIEPERIHFVGDPMAESVIRTMDEVSSFKAYREFALSEGAYVLGSFHRPENLEDGVRLRGLVAGLGRCPMPVLIPDANGFAQAVERAGLMIPSCVRIVDAVPYRAMLALQRDAAVVITDSGGVQVEACMIGVPCLTVRDCTEHVPTLIIGANSLVDPDGDAINAALVDATSRRTSWVPPARWDRAVSDRVARALKRGIIPLS